MISTQRPTSIAQRKRPPEQLVENRVCFAGPHAELSIYDTYESAQKVRLKASSILYCGMISGTKVLHTQQQSDIPFQPHESFILPPNEEVLIDFPTASLNQPTTCLTLELSKERIAQISEQMNDSCFSTIANSEVQVSAYQPLHTIHNQATQQLIERLAGHFMQHDPDRDLLVDLGVSELITRMLRHHGRDALLGLTEVSPDATGLTCVLDWIEQHLAQPLNIDSLSKMACMSRSRFYDVFKRQLGCTPAQYQHQRRMTQAHARLRQGLSVTQVSFELGYQSLSHFSRRFHQHFGLCPSQIGQRHLN